MFYSISIIIITSISPLRITRAIKEMKDLDVIRNISIRMDFSKDEKKKPKKCIDIVFCVLINSISTTIYHSLTHIKSNFDLFLIIQFKLQYNDCVCRWVFSCFLYKSKQFSLQRHAFTQPTDCYNTQLLTIFFIFIAHLINDDSSLYSQWDALCIFLLYTVNVCGFVFW